MQINEITKFSNSEDIQVLNEKFNRYLERQQEIREVIYKGNKINDEIVKDVVHAIFNLAEQPSWFNFVGKVKTIVVNFMKCKKLKKVIENILGKIFELSHIWYTMDYKDLKETCVIVGGYDFFNTNDHNYIYKAVRQQLKFGPIRDKCVKLGLEKFLNAKLEDINDNYLKFKDIEL